MAINLQTQQSKLEFLDADQVAHFGEALKYLRDIKKYFTTLEQSEIIPAVEILLDWLPVIATANDEAIDDLGAVDGYPSYEDQNRLRMAEVV